MGKKDNPFGSSERPSTDPFGRPIADSEDAFSSPAESADAFGSPAESADRFGSSASSDVLGSPAAPDAVDRPSSGDARSTASPAPADDPWRAAPPPSGDPWHAAPPPGDDDPAEPGTTRVADTAIPALVLGILGLFCWILSPFAWGLALKAEREIDASGGTLGGRSAATAGKVVGIIGTVLLILSILFIVLGLFVGTSIDSGTSTTITTAPR